VLNASSVFRDEALVEHFRGSRKCGELLRISPRWTNWTYWLLVAVFVAGSTYLVFGRINEYATGAAVVRDDWRTPVTALTGGTITDINVQPGQRVKANQLLLRFSDVQERIALNQLRRALNVQQINRLKNPNDPVAQQQVATVRVELETAERRLKERAVSAPRAGIVRDMRIRPHQFVAPGDLLLTIGGDDDALSIIAVLPGYYRPLLKPGHPLRVEVTGFRYAYQSLTISSVGYEIVGPAEVRRFLGQEIADSVTLQGSLVIVQARLPSRKFKAENHWHEYHDGMQGSVRARLRSERILFVLVPGLKATFEVRKDE
jgi:multidrug efflux pump subunit AcrA (membrane-fusion protein)